MQFIYPVNLKSCAEDEVVVQFPDFPEIICAGESEKDALNNAKDAVDEAIAGRMNRNEVIPEPNVIQNSNYIAVSLHIALKAAIYIQLKNLGINKFQFAKKLGIDEKVVRRLLDPRYNTHLKKLEQALKILHIEVVVGTYVSNIDPQPGKKHQPSRVSHKTTNIKNINQPPLYL